MALSVSLITVVRNDLNGLRKTADSVKKFTDLFTAHSGVVEWIVVDGNSSDGTAEFAVRDACGLDRDLVRATSERDAGLYDAMNKGTRRARFDWCWYMNAGDSICDLSSKEMSIFVEALVNGGDNILCFGCRRIGQRGNLAIMPREMGYLSYSLPTSHQAMLFPRVAAQGALYSLNYSLCADYEFACRLWSQGNQFKPIRVVLAEFLHNGYSSQHPFKLINEAARVQRQLLRLSYPLIVAMSLRRCVSLMATKMLDFIAFNAAPAK